MTDDDAAPPPATVTVPLQLATAEFMPIPLLLLLLLLLMLPLLSPPLIPPATPANRLLRKDIRQEDE